MNRIRVRIRRIGLRSVRKPENNTFSITPLLYDAPFPGNSREYPHEAYIARI